MKNNSRGFSLVVIVFAVVVILAAGAAAVWYFRQTAQPKPMVAVQKSESPALPEFAQEEEDSLAIVKNQNGSTVAGKEPIAPEPLPGNEIYDSLFDRYKTAEQFNGTPAPLDFKSDPAWLAYKTWIANAYNAYQPGMDNVFGGHYVFTFWGCGTSCRMGAIIDLNDGKIYGIPGGESESPEWGYYFVKNSDLLILNPIETTNCTKDRIDSDLGFCPQTKFYRWENNQFIKLSIDQDQLIKQASLLLVQDEAATVPENFSGTYENVVSYPNGDVHGSLYVVQTSASEIAFSLNIVIPRGNFGILSGARAAVDGNRAVYKEERDEYDGFSEKICKFEIVFNGNSAIINEIDGGTSYSPVCGKGNFGAEVGAEGVYKKIGELSVLPKFP